MNLSYIKMLKLVYTTQSRPCALCSAPTTHPFLILKPLQVGVSISATLEATEVAETDGHTIKSEEVGTSLSKD